MLADPRAQALVDNFAGSGCSSARSAGVVPDVDVVSRVRRKPARRVAARRPSSSSRAQLREDRSVVDLLTRQLHVPQRAAGAALRHSERLRQPFRRVTFTDGVRGGLLGQGSILTVTSYPNRTSPVLRGKWLLENMLGSPPPPPPPDVPALDETRRRRQPRSVRERMERTARIPACAACHVRMDPLGFALENFDALGKWRTTSDGAPIDASARCRTARSFDGRRRAAERCSSSHRDEFVANVTEKLLAYALGGASSTTTCRRSAQIARDAGSRATIAGRSLRSSASSKSTPFHDEDDHGEDIAMIDHRRRRSPRRTVLRGLGATAGAAAARQHGAGA